MDCGFTPAEGPTGGAKPTEGSALESAPSPADGPAITGEWVAYNGDSPGVEQPVDSQRIDDVVSGDR